MTISRMLREMTPEEFVLWRLKYEEDPWGEERGDLRSAQVAAILANTNRDPKKRDRPFEVIDFMPYAKRRLETERTQQEEATVKVDPMTLTWLLWKSRKTAKEAHGQ